MPARRAISSVDAPCRPRAANSICAASSTSARRSSALCLVVLAIANRLVATHYLVKHLADAADVLLRQARVERQGEGALVAAVGPRERALVAVGGQPVQRVGADLRLDSLLPQRLERLVPAVELDDVRLPAVPVSLLRARQLDEPFEPLGVGRRQPLARLEKPFEPPELRGPARAEDVREAGVAPRRRHVE